MPADEYPRARFRLLAGGASALFLLGCGGATPLLHPAHTLAPGRVTFGGGASGTFLAGQAKASLDDARAVAGSGGPTTDAERKELTEGTMASVLSTPGLAPWVGARVGVAERTEAGAAYTGRWMRVDARHAFENRTYALSIGLGALAMLAHPSADPDEPTGTSSEIAGVDSSGVYGYGFHVPVIVGYRSDAEVVQAWGGITGTFERAWGPVLLGDPTPSVPDDTVTPTDDAEKGRLDAQRFSGAALLGIAVGIEPIWVALELTGRYFGLDGTLSDGTQKSASDLSGWSLEPAGAILGRF